MQGRSVERRVELPASVTAVWQALTRGPELSAWFGAEVELEPHAGGRASFRWPDGTTREAAVEVFDPERQLLLRWLPFERDPRGAARATVPGHIRFVLESRNDHTVLTVIETLLGEPQGATLATAAQGSSS